MGTLVHVRLKSRKPCEAQSKIGSENVTRYESVFCKTYSFKVYT